MTEKGKVHKCDVCGNIVEVLHTGPGQLVCCNKPMTIQAENTTDAAQEKHVPVIEGSAGRYTVKVGSVAHPMEEKHYIEWIELNGKDQTSRRFLKPGEAPRAVFNVEGGAVSSRAYCNLHGFWKGDA